jgi:DNA-directed RNA polymerase subunit RPC12/RpoP
MTTHLMPNLGDVWHGYECLPCGVLWQVRAKEGIEKLKSSPCPTCGQTTMLRATWTEEEEVCLRGGKHVPDESSVQFADGDKTIVDIWCQKCGRSGSAEITRGEIQW